MLRWYEYIFLVLNKRDINSSKFTGKYNPINSDM